MDGRIQTIEGLLAAPHTPMHADGGLRLDSVEKQAAGLARAGVRGAFVCGSTGEGASLGVEERRQVAARWAAVAKGALSVIVHVGHTALPDACALAAHAQEVGADAVAAVAPFYFKPATIDDLIASVAPVAAAAPGLPFFYYHIPPMTGVDLPMTAFLERAGERIPNFAGIKYSEPDLMEFAECLRLAGDRYKLFWGCDEVLLGALAMGATAAVGSTYNHSAGLYLRMIAAHRAGDHAAAQAGGAQAVRLVRLLAARGVVPSGKALMTRLGVPCGPPRPPLRTLAAEEADRLFELLNGESLIDEREPR